MTTLPPMFETIPENTRVTLVDYKAGQRPNGKKFSPDQFDIHVKILKASNNQKSFEIDSLENGTQTSNDPNKMEGVVEMWMTEAEKFGASFETVPHFLQDGDPSKPASETEPPTRRRPITHPVA
ncbi:MAG: hypothetical protein ACK551_00315 [Vampirovibrionales bacterium]